MDKAEMKDAIEKYNGGGTDVDEPFSKLSNKDAQRLLEDLLSRLERTPKLWMNLHED